MKSKGYAVTYAGESRDYNKENYFLNGICKEDLESLSCCTMNKDVRSRNLFAVSSAVNSEVAGVDLAYIAVDVLKGFFGADFKTDNKEYFSIANSAITSHVFESGNNRFDVDSSIVYIEKDVATVYNIGDAPVFFFQNGNIKKLSGQVPTSVEVQKSSYDDYGNLKVRTVEKETARHLGVIDDSWEVIPYVSESIPLKSECAFVICSKAVEEIVGQNEIEKILSDKRIKESDKAIQIVNKAVENNPDGNYTVLVVQVTRGIPFAQAEVKSFYKWSAVAVACLVFCLYGTSIATGVGNFVKGIQSFIDFYTMGEKDNGDEFYYIPTEKPEEKETVKPVDTVQPAPEVVEPDNQPNSQTNNQPQGNRQTNTRPNIQPPQPKPAAPTPNPSTVQPPAVSEKTEPEKTPDNSTNSDKKTQNNLPIDFN